MCGRLGEERMTPRRTKTQRQRGGIAPQDLLLLLGHSGLDVAAVLHGFRGIFYR